MAVEAAVSISRDKERVVPSSMVPVTRMQTCSSPAASDTTSRGLTNSTVTGATIEIVQNGMEVTHYYDRDSLNKRVNGSMGHNGS